MTEFNGSAKDYAVTLGLAKPGKGRMSVPAREAVEKARQGGMTFSKESVQPTKRVVRAGSDSPQAKPAKTTEAKFEEYRDGAPRVHARGTEFVGYVDGKRIVTGLNNGAVACMNSGYSVAYCGEDSHKVLLSAASEPVTIRVKGD